MSLVGGIKFHRPDCFKNLFPKPHDKARRVDVQFDPSGIPLPHTDAARQGRTHFLGGLITKQSPVFQALKFTSQLKEISAEEFDKIIADATTITIFPALRGVRIPDVLTNDQKSKILSLLKAYNPALLKQSPIINVNGESITLNFDDSFVSSVDNLAVNLNEDQRKSISEMFSNYSGHLESLKDSVEVRKIEDSDVPKHEAALVGQEGVFAKKTIEDGTFVCMFDGMLLENSEDIENDKKLRKLAGCDNYFVRMVSQRGGVLEGMGMSMKLNVATALIYGYLVSNVNRNNLDAFFVHANNKQAMEVLKLVVFKANRRILKGEQLCYYYNVKSSR